MAVSKQKKEVILQELVEKFGRSKSVVFAANHGLSVSELQELRNVLREEGVEFKIAKKTLLEKACEESGITGVQKGTLDGPVGAAFSYEDEVAAAKLLAKFAKDHEALSLVAGIMEGKLMQKQEVEELSKLPSKEELLAKLVGSIQAPLAGFIGIGANLTGGLVRVLDQIRQQKESA